MSKQNVLSLEEFEAEITKLTDEELKSTWKNFLFAYSVVETKWSKERKDILDKHMKKRMGFNSKTKLK